LQAKHRMSKEKKDAYFGKLMDLFQQHSKLFLVNMDMVSSKQAQTVRFQLRGKGEMLMGKYHDPQVHS